MEEAGKLKVFEVNEDDLMNSLKALASTQLQHMTELAAIQDKVANMIHCYDKHKMGQPQSEVGDCTSEASSESILPCCLVPNVKEAQIFIFFAIFLLLQVLIQYVFRDPTATFFTYETTPKPEVPEYYY